MGDTGTWVRKPADLHGTWQTDVVLTGQSSRNLCYPIFMWKVPVLQHLNVYKRFVLQSLVLDTCIKAITKNASGS